MMLSLPSRFLVLSLSILCVTATIGDYCQKGGASGSCQKTSNCASGVTSPGLCPDDPGDVLCCFPHYPCNIDTFPGVCQDKTTNKCAGTHGYMSGLCPGDKNVQCCLSTSTVDKFVDHLKTTYNLAVQYKSTSNAPKSSNELVMEWLRHEHYDGLKSGWDTLIGSVDDAWIAFAKSKSHPIFGEFADPHFCGTTVGADHLGASMNAVFRYPPPEYPKVNRGDFGGWGGDLSTLYAEWRDADSPPARAWVKSQILGKGSSFKLQDFIEDADAFNIGLILSNLPARAIHEVAADYYKPKGGYRTRFSSFYTKRFGGTRAEAVELAREMLTGGGDAAIVALRTAAIQKTSLFTALPSWLKKEVLDPFLEGFVDALVEVAGDKGVAC